MAAVQRIEPEGLLHRERGLSVRHDVTRPPIAFAPYSSVAGRADLDRRRHAGSRFTPVARLTGLIPHAKPSSTIRNASPSSRTNHRRAGPGPKLRIAIPGRSLDRRSQRALQLLVSLLAAEHSVA
jgi:hypothetical protein